MKKYNLINNSLGWLVFVVALVSYMLTLEPTASFWDCGEFIAQGYKLEVGHPPGNPIFMLAANFFTHFASTPEQVALCVNAMSGLLSAGTILLLFWTITHLVRKLITRDDATDYSWRQMSLIMGSGIAGALAYAWSDTFWFSAVEAEVYAFSSFCTALTFWLILKWENRADSPYSDRYLIAIAYVIGVSVAVHLLNLLCIPAIVLVIYYKKFPTVTARGSLLALSLSFVIIAFILFGLVPGFVEMAQYSELLFVNTLGFGFNTGVIAYTLFFVALLCWMAYAFFKNDFNQMRLSFLLTTFFSGIFFMGNSFIIPLILIAGLSLWLFKFVKKSTFPHRTLYIIGLSIGVIFVGYSSYALILIRSNSQTPMDQNSPDNVFALGSYLNREQYGRTPLFYGPTYASPVLRNSNGLPVITEAKTYTKEVKSTPDAPDRYVEINDDFKRDCEYPSNTKMIFPRLYDSGATDKYQRAMGGIETTSKEVDVYSDGVTELKDIPTFSENLRYFFQYQLNYMYWRYFLWNFAGRQNDIQGHGEITHGNWISGFSFIDNPRLGDQSLLPEDLGEGNAGHNVFYMLPLLLGIIGLLWQAYIGKRGIEQFWVVFFLFFMTGIAIVVYLNQIPEQPRERDYAYAGSFYAFAIWIGMGVAGLYALLKALCRLIMSNKNKMSKGMKNCLAGVAVGAGIIVPLQMVSQTWDDHDRSGRYACRDFGMNYLSSVEPNGIIFTSGDNDTFPLWYAQEVEGWRTDVRVVNLSYLATDWYMAQMRRPSYEAQAIPMQAVADTYAYGHRTWGSTYYYDNDDNLQFFNRDVFVPALESIADYYSPDNSNPDTNYFRYPCFYIPLKPDVAVERGYVPADKKMNVADSIAVDLYRDQYFSGKDQYTLSSSKAMEFDMISSIINQGWKRPIYFAMTIPDEYHSFFYNFLQSSGMAYNITPIDKSNKHATMGAGFTDKAYRNITEKFRWGGLDVPGAKPYYDETAARMANTTRLAILETVEALLEEGETAEKVMNHAEGETEITDIPARCLTKEWIADRYNKARTLLQTIEKKVPFTLVPANFTITDDIARYYYRIADYSKLDADRAAGDRFINATIDKYAAYIRYYQSLSYNQLSGLTQTDLYLFNEGGFLSLLCTYNEGNPKAAKAKVAQLEKSGVNVWTLFNRAASSCGNGSKSAIYNLYHSYIMLNDVDENKLSDFLQKNPNCAEIVYKVFQAL